MRSRDRSDFFVGNSNWKTGWEFYIVKFDNWKIPLELEISERSWKILSVQREQTIGIIPISIFQQYGFQLHYEVGIIKFSNFSIFPTTLFNYMCDYFELTLSRNCFSAMTLIFFLSWAAVNRNYEQLSVFVHFGCRILAVCQSNWLKFIFVTRLSGIGFCQHYRNDADLHCCLLNLPQIET